MLDTAKIDIILETTKCLGIKKVLSRKTRHLVFKLLIGASPYLSKTLLNSSTLILTGSTMNSGRL